MKFHANNRWQPRQDRHYLARVPPGIDFVVRKCGLFYQLTGPGYGVHRHGEYGNGALFLSTNRLRESGYLGQIRRQCDDVSQDAV